MSLTIAAPCPAFEQFDAFSAVMPEAEPCFEQSNVFSSVWEIELTTVAELGLVLAPNVSAHIKADLVLEVDEGYGVQSALAMHNAHDPARAVQVGDLVLNDRVVGYTRILRIARWTWSVAPQRTLPMKAPLGITMMGPPKAGRIRVLEIQMATPFAEWNKAHPQLALQPAMNCSASRI